MFFLYSIKFVPKITVHMIYLYSWDAGGEAF